jgi:hypothetical protein
MSAMPQIEQDRSGTLFWQGRLFGRKIPIDAAQSSAFDDFKPPEDQAGISRFRGQIEIPGFPLLPEQDFTASCSGDEYVIENQPADHWPLISLHYYRDPSSRDFEFNHIFINRHDVTVDAELLLTRIEFFLFRAGKLLLRSNQIGELSPIEIEMHPQQGKTALDNYAKMARKLKYLERVFKTSFSIPEEISWQDAFNIEFVFRGIIEGEFTTRGGDITFFNVPLFPIDLTKPPFQGPGPFSYKLGSKIALLGKELIVGPVTVHLDKAELASPRVVDHVRKGLTKPVDVRFEVLDNQITCRFETYARSSRKQRLQRLNQFKQELAREEPKGLVDLIDESLQGDVTPDEANQIAMGWTLYTDLPDRYCPQEPELDRDSGHWRVPIYLVYANGEGGSVGELVIDIKTGKIIRETPIEELRSKGLALAKQILHA